MPLFGKVVDGTSNEYAAHRRLFEDISGILFGKVTPKAVENIFWSCIP
jgi:hypothetical protein